MPTKIKYLLMSDEHIHRNFYSIYYIPQINFTQGFLLFFFVTNTKEQLFWIQACGLI